MKLWEKPYLLDWNDNNERCDEYGDVFMSIEAGDHDYYIVYVPAYGRGMLRYDRPFTGIMSVAEAKKIADELWRGLPEWGGFRS
jgi:hypothetical protein